MINIILFFTLILMSACSHKRSFFNHYKDRQLYVKKYTVVDSIAAENLIQNRLNFLRMIFRPSSNPYTDLPLMPPECIKENQIGTLLKDGKNLIAVSIVNVDIYGNAGFCSDNPKAAKVHSIYLYCKEDNYVFSFQFKFEPDFEDKFRKMEFCEI